YWLYVKKGYPALAERALKSFLPFATTYLSESGFSTLKTWAELVQTTYQSEHGANGPSMSASQRLDTEVQLLRQAQLDTFPEEVNSLQTGKEVRTSSKLSNLSPEYDVSLSLIRVGGRLRRAENLAADTLHPILLSPDHPTTQIIIKDYDHRLLHPGPERVFAELRRMSRVSYFAVFDGRGGARASRFAAENLHLNLAKN
ncbi:hypothetical protein KUCAC02_017030, partial [Chaenocephalus aceratus]